MGTFLDASVLIHLERTGFTLSLADDEDVAISAITASELLHGRLRVPCRLQASSQAASSFALASVKQTRRVSYHIANFAAVNAVGHISGCHITPAVTIALASTKKVTGRPRQRTSVRNSWAPAVDFSSIGTNDLVQYTRAAADRTSAEPDPQWARFLALDPYGAEVIEEPRVRFPTVELRVLVDT